MERSDERLSTRDIASPAGAGDAPPESAGADRFEPAPADAGESRFERDERAAGHPVTEDTMATMADPASAAAERQPERDLREPADGAATADPVAPDPGAAEPTVAEPATASTGAGDAAPLLAEDEGFRSRWEDIQVRFVDEPRGAVEDADALVATVMQRLAEGFAQERERLEAQWGRGEDISTEDLRIALQRYRSFFQRLLST
jgi:hypothetical protein